MLKALKQYLPFFGMVLVAVLQSAKVAFDDSVITPTEMFVIALAFLGALTTYVIPRLPGALAWLKTAVAALLAAVTVLSTAYVGGVSPTEWINIILTVLGVLGVAVTTRFVPETVPVGDNVVPGAVVSKPEAGESVSGLLVTILVLVVLALLIAKLV